MELRARFQRRAIGRFRRRPAVLLFQASAAAEVRLGKLRIDHQGLLEAGQRGLLLAQVLQRAAQVRVRLGVLRVLLEGASKRGGGLRQFTAPLKQQTKVIVGFGAVRCQGEAFSVGAFGAGRVPGRREHHAQIEMIDRPLAVNRNRPANEIGAGLVVARLMCQQAEQMKRVRVSRILSQRGSVGLFSLLQAAALVQFDSRRERILHA